MRHALLAITVPLLLAIVSANAAARESEAEAEANRVAHDHVLCGKYGYEEGTDDFRKCLDVLASRRAESAAKARRRSVQEGHAANALNSGCDTRGQVINGGGRGGNAHEAGVGGCQ